MVLRRTRAQRTSTGRRDRRTERRRRAARRAGLQAGLPQAAFLFGCTLLFSFAQMPFGSMPAAPAFFAALLAFDEAAVWGMAGVVAGALAGVWRGAMMQGWQLPVCIAISLAMPVARRLCAPRWHGAVFALSALAASLPTLFVESARFLPALRCLELAACVLILTPVFGRLLHLLTDRADARADDVLCALLFILCVLCGLCGMNAGFLARMLAAVGTACIALACGPGAGVAFGGATGLTLTLLGRTPAEGVLLLVAGLLCGVARRWGRWGVAGAMGAAALCAGATVDPSLFRPGPMASVLAAACAPALCPPAWLDRLCARVEPLLDRETAADAVRSLAFHGVRDMANGIREMTDALPAPDAPDETEAARVERFAQNLCARCERRERCWNERYERTRRRVLRLLRPLPERTDEETERVAREMGCLQPERFAQARREQLQQERHEHAVYARCVEQRAAIRRQLGAVSQAVSRLSGDMLDGADAQLGAAIDRALARAGLRARVAYAARSGGRVRALIERADGATADRLRAAAEAGAGRPMRCLMEELSQEELYFEEDAPLDAEVTVQSVRKAGEEVAGDGSRTGRLRGGRCFAALSDGMGSGGAARRESQATLRLLERCLRTGYSRAQALKAVNSLMLACAGEDVFATLDLCLLDLYEGRATLDKLGACTSFLLRGDECEAFEADALPLGMLPDVQPCSRQIELETGDLIVMMTDGVADAIPGGMEGVRQAILSARAQEPRALCRSLIERALRAQRGAAGDDMTVMCVRIVPTGARERRRAP